MERLLCFVIFMAYCVNGNAEFLNFGYACANYDLAKQIETLSQNKDSRGISYLLNHGCIVTKKGMPISVLSNSGEKIVRIRIYNGDDAVTAYTNKWNIISEESFLRENKNDNKSVETRFNIPFVVSTKDGHFLQADPIFKLRNQAIKLIFDKARSTIKNEIILTLSGLTSSDMNTKEGVQRVEHLVKSKTAKILKSISNEAPEKSILSVSLINIHIL